MKVLSKIVAKKEGSFILKLLVAVVVLVVTAFVADALTIFVYGKWRYKMTVTVETPEGVKTGSTVREISNWVSIFRILSLPQQTNPPKVKGEAVVVDLGEWGLLFGLLDRDGSYGAVFEAFPFPDGAPNTISGIKYYRSLKNAKAILYPGTTTESDKICSLQQH